MGSYDLIIFGGTFLISIAVLFVTSP